MKKVNEVNLFVKIRSGQKTRYEATVEFNGPGDGKQIFIGDEWFTIGEVADSVYLHLIMLAGEKKGSKGV